MAKDRLGGLWFHDGTQCSWTIWRLPGLASTEKDASNAVKARITDAAGTWFSYDSIQTWFVQSLYPLSLYILPSPSLLSLSENLQAPADQIELWYVSRSGLRPIIYREGQGISKGMPWMVKSILREATFAAPTLCFPANPQLKCLIQSLTSVSWPYQKYYLGFHHLPVIEEGVSPSQQQRM